MFIFSIAASSAATRPAARSRCCCSDTSSAPVTALVTRFSASRFCRSRSRPRLSSSAFSSSSRCWTSGGTSTLSWARPSSAFACAACCSRSSSFMPRSISFCSHFFCASWYSARFSASWRSSISASSRSTLSPCFTAWPSGARNAILKSTSAIGGTPISVERTAASSPSTSTLSTRSARFTAIGWPASGPPPARSASSSSATAATAAKSHARRGRPRKPRAELRKPRHDRPPRGRQGRRTRAACRRRASRSWRRRPGAAPPAPASRSARRRAAR